MLRFKQFAGPVDEIERAVNSWLNEFEPDVSQMVQTVGESGTIVIGFLFQESFRGQEIRFTAERGERQRPPVKPDPNQRDAPLVVPIEPGTPVTEADEKRIRED
ncbi:MAG: hypothetical protein ACRDFX_07825 [Chloroflexota bacterium]